MARRMDRYKEGNIDINRSKKNKTLYNSLNNTTMYTTLSDVRNANAYMVDRDKDQYNTREGYQRIKDYDSSIVRKIPKEQKQLDDINYLYQERGNKIYDINSVIEEAKKNRTKDAIEEEKRKIKDEKYKITLEEIEKYRKEKLNKNKPDKEAMIELTNTIISKTLSGDLDQATSVDLLSDLLATNEMDRVEINDDDNTTTGDIHLTEDDLNIEDLAKVKEEMDNTTQTDVKLKDLDPSFYTKSMDLSDKDFFAEEDDDEDEHKTKVPAILKLFLLLLLAGLLAVLIYFIIQSF